MKPKIILCLAVVLSGGLFGCSTTNQRHNWPVFYDSEKGPTQLSISRAAQTVDFYTNGIPVWNYDLLFPAAKINSAAIQDLGDVDGRRVIEVQLALADMYYTDVVMVLEEVESGRFLPVYVQDYNRDVRWPTANIIIREKKQLTINAGMEYAGTGHFHHHYKITIAPNRNPVVELDEKQSVAARISDQKHNPYEP
jgi:hypothetical protein